MKNKIVILLAVTLQSAFAGTVSNVPSCKSYFDDGGYTKINESTIIPRFVKSYSLKGEYEKTVDFNKRIELENKTERDRIERDVRTLAPSGFVGVSYDYRLGQANYNADKGVFELDSLFFISNTKISSGIKGESAISVRSVTIKIGESKTNFTTYGPYSTKEEYRESFGIYYRTKLKSPYLKEGNHSKLEIKMSPDEAKKIKESMSLVMIGKLIPPYSDRSGHSTNVILDMTCAAIIDKKSGKLLLEIK